MFGSKKIKIFPKLLISILFVVAIPLSGLWYVNIVQYQDELQGNLRENLTQVGDLAAEKVNGWATTNLQLLQQNSLLQDIKSMETEKQSPILKSILNAYDWTFLVYAVGTDGYKTARSDDRAIINDDGSKAFFRGDREYFKQVMSDEDFGQQVLLSRSFGYPAFILCTAIRSGTSAVNSLVNKLPIVGSLCLGATLEKVSAVITELEVGETGYAILMDKSNKVIAHGQPEVLSEKLQDFSNHPAIVANTKGYSEYSVNGVKKVAYRTITDKGWSIIIEKDYAEAFQPLDNAKREAFIFFGVTVLISLLMSAWISSRIANPIQRLTTIADGISKGNFTYEKGSVMHRGDEIGSLAKAIDRMAVSIQIAFRKLKQK